MGLFDFLRSKNKTPQRPFVESMYGEGNGSSLESAIVVRAANSSEGIAAEYAWIENKYGQHEVDWIRRDKNLGQDGDRIIESFVIETKAGESHEVWFDITGFFGRW